MKTAYTLIVVTLFSVGSYLIYKSKFASNSSTPTETSVAPTAPAPEAPVAEPVPTPAVEATPAPTEPMSSTTSVEPAPEKVFVKKIQRAARVPKKNTSDEVLVAKPAPEAEPKEEAIQPREVATNEVTDIRPHFSVWGGIGAGHLSYEQTGTADSESANFSSTMFPVVALGANVRIFERLNFNFDYHRYPGKIGKRDGVTIKDDKFEWNSVSYDLQYRFLDKQRTFYSLILGLQKYDVPFLSENADSTVSLIDNHLTNFVLGLQVNYMRTSDIEIVGSLKYQHLMDATTSADSITIKPNLMLSGSVGIVKRFPKGFNAGVFWTGHKLDYDYDLKRDGTKTTGSQNLFNSAVEFRVGWEFQ